MFIPKGVQEASDILSRSTKYFVYYDPDIDGLIAGSFVTKLLTDYGKQSIYYINENREHGFTIPLEKLDAYVGYTVIAVDFSMSDEILKSLVDMGINVINIDHHQTKHTELFKYTNSDNGCSCVLINNQYSFEPEEHRYQSGAGMVYYTFSAMFPEYMNTHRNRALVGISLLSDVREIENNNAAQFLSELYSWSDDYSRYLINLTTDDKFKSGFGEQKFLDRNFVDFSFSPKFNALFRMNMGDTAIKLFNKVSVNIDLSDIRLQQKVITANLKTKLTNHSVSDALTIMSVDVSGYPTMNYNITNFIGLVCGQVKDDTNATTFLFVTDGEQIVRGSVRGKYDNVDYLEIFERFGINAAGHKGAFGVRSGKLSEINFILLSEAVAEAEVKRPTEEAVNRIMKVYNLRTTTFGENKHAIYNNFVRDDKRFVYDCSECKYKVEFESQAKEYILYSIDDIRVKCFNKSLTPKNAYVMPLINNNYVEYYLKKCVR